MMNDKTTIVRILPGGPEPFTAPQAMPPVGLEPQGETLRQPLPFETLLRRLSSPRLQGPLLVARAGSHLGQMLTAQVYPLGGMITLPAPPQARLAGEVMRFCLGRTTPNDIMIDDTTVSKRHAAIVRFPGDRWALLDEGSSNGTFIDGRRLAPGKPEPLGVLATLRFGPRQTFAFMHPAVFHDYLAQLRAEYARQPDVAPVEAPRTTFDTVQRTAQGSTFEPLAARIMATLRRAPAVSGYVVTLEKSGPVEVATLSEASATVENDPTAVVRVEGKAGGGLVPIYERSGTTRVPA